MLLVKVKELFHSRQGHSEVSTAINEELPTQCSQSMKHVLKVRRSKVCFLGIEQSPIHPVPEEEVKALEVEEEAEAQHINPRPGFTPFLAKVSITELLDALSH